MPYTLSEIRKRFAGTGQEPPREEISLEGFCRSAILLPLVEAEGACHVLLTRRTELVETHKGQICFPGGAADPDDRDVVHTALREAEEELGIQPENVEVIGLLDDLGTPTGFIITPVVGLLEHLPLMTLSPHEVAEAFLVPLEFFLDPAQGRSEMREFRGLLRQIWFYQYGQHQIWGATALMLRSLLIRLKLLKAGQ